ncbi:MAG TPA: ATP-binding protein, partial [Thermoanaerobaculia bacterium]|nr:ATP-binding protein [Thermoanaerobaculia bacterium]
AHDFNNLLTAILCYSDSLLMALEDEPTGRLRADVEQIRRAGERAAALTRQLLAFSRRQILDLEPLDLNAIVRDAATMLGPLLGERIGLDVALAPALGAIRSDRSQMDQVVLNLVLNARDAMPNGGRILIETAEIGLGSRDARARGLAPGRYVRLAVTDEGVGMDESVRSRIFEPFFTTKPPGRGTGLGLSTVHGIVRQTGGDVRVSSAPGRGATFEVLLPRVG